MPVQPNQACSPLPVPRIEHGPVAVAVPVAGASKLHADRTTTKSSSRVTDVQAQLPPMK